MTEVVLLGNVVLRPQLRKKLTQVRLLWDANELKFPNFPEADSFLRREYRQGWQ